MGDRGFINSDRSRCPGITIKPVQLNSFRKRSRGSKLSRKTLSLQTQAALPAVSTSPPPIPILVTGDAIESAFKTDT
ncbi:hypothetical protein RRG08_055483 [Elysia crispata]|uniref:Uncharacterized protein n=1 Tax=Elysia crispata TaxID=231223 RepID=A0AAE0XQM9_9GAST|nr:hypothetical protein RRG08_055483 [Elysia crispata]